ncbi:hypothetical protein D3C80_1690760 [compost metagenome]
MWLAQDLFAQHGNLIGADNQVVGVGGGQCLGLCRCQSQHQRFGAFPGQWGFIDLGSITDKRQMQFFQ